MKNAIPYCFAYEMYKLIAVNSKRLSSLDTAKNHISSLEWSFSNCGRLLMTPYVSSVTSAAFASPFSLQKLTSKLPV